MTLTSDFPRTSEKTVQVATFRVENLLLAIDVDVVQEINRHLNITEVPHAPENVRGVINLRGEVVTVVDMRTILGLPRGEVTRDCRNVVIHSEGELIGLIVDQIADILTIPIREIDPPPANVDGVEGRFFKGVYTMDNGIAVLLDVQGALSQD
ncbi:MAG: purine-binding chemotaxis protein CheW [Planctomycetales bacterium]|nr:purine-binding chemotaxis protein CheW [Planctomycetales bacterium]